MLYVKLGAIRGMSSNLNNPVLNLNVTELLDDVPQARSGGSMLPLLLVVVVVSTMVMAGGGGAPWLQTLMPVLVAGLIVMTFMRASRVAMQQRQEQQAVREIDEAIRLGNWQQAGELLVNVLKQPAKRPHVQVQAMIYLGSVLSHENRFEDVERVYNHLLKNGQLPPQIEAPIRCARAYAMLREDRLTDAYETLSQLKRDSQGTNSAMVALLELYQKVKTGHDEDALALFGEKRRIFAQQLGHRSADAWALAAAAALRLGRQSQAVEYARNARLLSGRGAMEQRFPECVAAMALAGAGSELPGQGVAQ